MVRMCFDYQLKLHKKLSYIKLNMVQKSKGPLGVGTVQHIYCVLDLFTVKKMPEISSALYLPIKPV